MEQIVKAIGNGHLTVTIGDSDLTLMEAAKKLASDAMDSMTGERLRLALNVAAAVADYANFK